MSNFHLPTSNMIPQDGEMLKIAKVLRPSAWRITTDETAHQLSQRKRPAELSTGLLCLPHCPTQRYRATLLYALVVLLLSSRITATSGPLACSTIEPCQPSGKKVSPL